ncbi:MAG: hypothetical protein H0T66_00030 [Geodermatophilaceae bacterium]|nr:hypothetical protein [Geodermatophilaceae bacterium]
MALATARPRIADLDAEVKNMLKDAGAVGEVVHPKVRYRLVADGIDVVHACWPLVVSRSEFPETGLRRGDRAQRVTEAVSPVGNLTRPAALVIGGWPPFRSPTSRTAGRGNQTWVARRGRCHKLP